MDGPALHRPVSHQALSITPMTGVVGPDSSVTIHVNFKPLEVQQMGREFSGYGNGFTNP